MRSGGRFGRIAGAGAALLIPFVPKCPLCLLPLAAAIGVALPSQPVLDGVVAIAASAWLAVTLASARWPPLKVASIAAAALLLGGRWLGVPWAGGLGAVLVLGVVFWTHRRARSCRSAACLEAKASSVAAATLLAGPEGAS